MADSYPIYGPFGYSNPNSSASLIIRLMPSYKKEQYVDGSGDLDEHNGRWSITPEFPQGTYVYYTTYDDTGTPLFPYIIGRKYYGTVFPQSGPATTTPVPTAPVKNSCGCLDILCLPFWWFMFFFSTFLNRQ
jgi:hypothetical protein